MLRVNGQGSDLLLLTWSAAQDSRAIEEAEDAYRSLNATLRQEGAVPIQERVFTDLRSAPCIVKGRARAVGSNHPMWAVPPTCIEGGPIGREGMAGIHVLAVRDGSARLLTEHGLTLGRLVETPSARFLGLADVGRRSVRHCASGPAEDAADSIEAAIELLEREGFSFRDVARTWFYLRDILDWYGPFNAVRNAAFRQLGLLGPNGNGAIPASTGIEGRNPRGGWCTLDVVATQARNGSGFEMTRLRSQRQNEATEYGSAFARGMSLTLGNWRYVFVSGTASIDDRGATVHVGDFAKQMQQTLAAMDAVLQDAGATLGDIEQATSFIKDPADLPTYERTMEGAGLGDLPALATVADVCRDDLLFEIDATAVVPLDGSE